MSIRIGQLALATSVAQTDQLLIEQGSPPITRRIAVSQALNSVLLTINNQTGTTYTLAAGDGIQTMIRMLNAAAMTVTIPNNTAIPFAIGTNLLVFRAGVGTLTIAGATGVTVQSSSSLTARAQYSVVCLVKTDVNTWVLTGDIT